MKEPEKQKKKIITNKTKVPLKISLDITRVEPVSDSDPKGSIAAPTMCKSQIWIIFVILIYGNQSTDKVNKILK